MPPKGQALLERGRSHGVAGWGVGVIPFSSCPQSLPASESFPMSQLCMRWPKYWSFSLSISPSNEHPELISFRMVWLDLLAVQGTLKSLLQHHFLSSNSGSRGLLLVSVSELQMDVNRL